MKLVLITFLTLFSIQCSNSKHKDRTISAAQSSCILENESLTQMRNKLVSGECNNLQYFCDASAADGLVTLISDSPKNKKKLRQALFKNSDSHYVT